MRYLRKTEESRILAEEWQYARESQRKSIRDELLVEQSGFCAYSERFIKATDAIDIEHFDPRLKDKPQDSYWNWYGVLVWMNRHKARSIEQYVPFAEPFDSTIPRRVCYDDGLYVLQDENDIEMKNLRDFLGWNKPEVVKDRRAHVKRVLDLQQLCNDLLPREQFIEFLCRDRENLSFASALEAELGFPITVALD